MQEQAAKVSSRINTTIDMQSPKVATLVQVNELKGKKVGQS